MTFKKWTLREPARTKSTLKLQKMSSFLFPDYCSSFEVDFAWACSHKIHLEASKIVNSNAQISTIWDALQVEFAWARSHEVHFESSKNLLNPAPGGLRLENDFFILEI